MAKRPIWLIATALALFGLQVPLCALACMQGSDAESTASQRVEPPCHGLKSGSKSVESQGHQPSPAESSGNASPTKAPCSQEECGCDFAYEALLPGIDSISNQGSLALILGSTPGRPNDSSMPRFCAVPTSTDLPPPDILLLKSTLLI